MTAWLRDERVWVLPRWARLGFYLWLIDGTVHTVVRVVGWFT